MKKYFYQLLLIFSRLEATIFFYNLILNLFSFYGKVKEMIFFKEGGAEAYV